MSDKKPGRLHIRGHLIAGVLTLIPILVVWFVLEFLLALLFRFGAPLERALVDTISRVAPAAAPILTNSVFEWCVAVIVALLLIYAIGAAASHVVGTRLLALFERLIARIPLVQTIYSASKKLIAALQPQPGSGNARIVLIDFPYPGMKVVGLVMKTLKDANTGEELAVVYVPTAPNPTSGYLEVVPLKDLVSTDLTMDQAMTMVVSGGAITPDNFSMTDRGAPLSSPDSPAPPQA